MLEEKITEVVDKLMLLSEQLATPAFLTILKAIQVESIWFLTVGLILVVSLPLLYMATCKMTRITQATYERDRDDANVVIQTCLSLVLGISTIGFVIAVMAILLDVSNWIGAFDPVTELARRIIAQ